MLKRAIKTFASASLGWNISSIARARGVVVLMYHRISQPGDLFPGLELDHFVEQMRWVRSFCRPIAPEEFVEATASASRRRPPVLVTFDDGYRDYHDNAYPVLQELAIPAVVFLATSFIDTRRLIWTDEVWAAFTSTRVDRISLPWAPERWLSTADAGERRAAAAVAKGHLKSLPDEERQAAERRLYEALGYAQDDPARERQMLSWDEARAVRGLTRFGGHTHTHPILSQLEVSQADAEIRICREVIERELGETPRTFAYPNGTSRDFTHQTCESVRRHGFDLAFSTEPGVNGPGTDMMRIRRQPTGASSVADFAWLVAGH